MSDKNMNVEEIVMKNDFTEIKGIHNEPDSGVYSDSECYNWMHEDDYCDCSLSSIHEEVYSSGVIDTVDYDSDLDDFIGYLGDDIVEETLIENEDIVVKRTSRGDISVKSDSGIEILASRRYNDAMSLLDSLSEQVNGLLSMDSKLSKESYELLDCIEKIKSLLS